MSNRHRSIFGTIVHFIVVVFLILFLISAFGLVYITNWFTDWSRFIDTDEEQQDVESSVVITESENSGISLYSSQISADEYLDYALDYGIYIDSDFGGYLLTASITPSFVVDSTVDWYSTFVSTGRDASSYISVNPLSDGGLTAVVVREKALSEQVVITVSLRSDSSIYAECTVDTLPRYTYQSFYLDYVTSETTTSTSTSLTRETASFTSSVSIPYISGGSTIKVTSLTASTSKGSISTGVLLSMYLTVLDIDLVSDYVGFDVYCTPILMYSIDMSSYTYTNGGYISYFAVFTDKNGDHLAVDVDEDYIIRKYIKSNLGTAVLAFQFSVSYSDYPEYNYDTYVPIYLTES